MTLVFSAMVVLGAVVWLGILMAPWRPWSTRERLQEGPGPEPLDDVTALIPARNEEETLRSCLQALLAQSDVLDAIVVDDRSEDATGAVARGDQNGRIHVMDGEPPPSDWSGKLWALEQGFGRVSRRYTLLLDADVVLAPGVVAALKRTLVEGPYSMASVMVELRMHSFPERWLMPAFIYFFKLLYPFHLANGSSRVAAAAGGCVLIETELLRRLGGPAAIRDELIDDCALAGKVKASGERAWIGLTRSARSVRAYNTLAPIWEMVARNAYTQLRYSPWLLLAVSLVMAAAFWVVPLAAMLASGVAGQLALVACVAMVVAYTPLLVYYGRSPLWALAMPLTGTAFLAMTLSSAWRYYRGVRSEWKGRRYAARSTND